MTSKAINPVPAVALWPLIAGLQSTQLVYVAAKLKIPDLLGSGPKSSEEIAEAMGTDPDATARVLRGMAALKLVSMERDGCFATAPLGEHLRSSAPGGMHDWAILGGELHYACWGGILHSVKSGESGLRRATGLDMWSYLAENPELRSCFHRAMTAGSEEIGRALSEAHDFSDVKSIADIGGGNGALLACLLQATPSLTGTLYEAPDMLQEAGELLRAKGVAHRCTLLSGDFFESVPRGAERYLLKNILHDWKDEDCVRILGNCRAAMDERSRLLIVEMLMPDRPEEVAALIQIDLQMLVGPGGKKRSVNEFRDLLSSAAFDLVQAVDLPVWGWSFLEASPAPQ